MRRFLINSNNVNYNKRKRRYAPGGVDEVSTEGVPSLGQPQYQWQGQQEDFSKTVPGTENYSNGETGAVKNNTAGGGLLMTAFSLFGNTMKGFKGDIEQTNPDGTLKDIHKANNLSYAGQFTDPLGIFSGVPAWKSGQYRRGLVQQDKDARQVISRQQAQQQLEDYRIDNPYRENQATFAMGGENNMSQSNELNSFNGGDGSQDSIERPNSFVNNKETEHKNIIHSNSFVITPEMAEHYNLPDSVIDKTPSEASLILSKDTIRTKPQHNEQKLLHTSNIKDQFAIAADKANKRNEVGIYALDKLSKEIGELLNPQQPEQQGQPEMQQQNVPDDMTLNGGMAYGGIHIKKSHRGLLHKNLGVKEGEKIPASKLVVKSTDSPAMKKRKIFAQNSSHFKH